MSLVPTLYREKGTRIHPYSTLLRLTN